MCIELYVMCRYDYVLSREYNWNVKNKASRGYEENYFFVMKEDGVFYNELETRYSFYCDVYLVCLTRDWQYYSQSLTQDSVMSKCSLREIIIHLIPPLQK